MLIDARKYIYIFNINGLYEKLALLLIIFSFGTYGQSNSQAQKKETATTILSPISIPDKLNVILPKEYFEKQKSDWTKDYLPPLLTLLAGLLTVAINWLISKKLRLSTEKNFEKQLSETKTNIEKQLAEAKSLKMAELKASINIKNRQEWMNQYRDSISEFMALVTINY